jgi:hypothetical protein
MYGLTPFVVLLVVSVLARGVCGAEDPMRAAVRARLALMRLHSSVSSDRVFFVSGARTEDNARILDDLQETRLAVEQLLRVPMPTRGQSIRFFVLPPEEQAADPAQGVGLVTERRVGEIVHRIVVPHYASVYVPETREAVVAAMLSAYLVGAGVPLEATNLPAWFLGGVLEVLHPLERKVSLASLDVLWASGAIPSLHVVFRALQEAETLSEAQATIAGGLVLWLASRPSEEKVMSGLLVRMAANAPVDVAWLSGRMGADPDGLFERWVLAQRRAVRGVGTIMRLHIDHVRSVLLLYPGQHGIPRRAKIVSGAPLHVLAQHRERAWFREAVQQRRQVLQLAAQGRPARYQEIVGQFLAVLDGVEDGLSDEILEEREQRAYLALERLAREVDAAGGVLQDS